MKQTIVVMISAILLSGCFSKYAQRFDQRLYDLENRTQKAEIARAEVSYVERTFELISDKVDRLNYSWEYRDLVENRNNVCPLQIKKRLDRLDAVNKKRLMALKDNEVSGFDVRLASITLVNQVRRHRQ